MGAHLIQQPTTQYKQAALLLEGTEMLLEQVRRTLRKGMRLNIFNGMFEFGT